VPLPFLEVDSMKKMLNGSLKVLVILGLLWYSATGIAASTPAIDFCPQWITMSREQKNEYMGQVVKVIEVVMRPSEEELGCVKGLANRVRHNLLSMCLFAQEPVSPNDMRLIAYNTLLVECKLGLKGVLQ
jgi:hypothetical protein